MGKITFDKPQLLTPLRLAFGAAAVGIAAAAWWFTKSDYEPVRLLTPEEQAALSKDPARYPAPKNWEDSFIREKVPGEGRAEESNAWVQAVAEPKQDPNDPWVPRDEIEKKICDLYDLESYRSAKAAWAAYQARPATARERYELLNKTNGALYMNEVTGLDHMQRARMIGNAAYMALMEALEQPVPQDPIAAYEHYDRMMTYRGMVGLGHGLEEDPLSNFLSIEGSDLNQKWLLYKEEARDQRIKDFIAVYRQGLKPGAEGIAQYKTLDGGRKDISSYFWIRIVPDESSPEYQGFVEYAKKLGISPDEAKGIARFLTVSEREDADKHRVDAGRFRETRGPDNCPSP